MSQQLAVGKEIITFCSKCDLKLSHLIMSMKDANTPHKLQCKTCKSEHMFRSAKKAPAKKKALSAKSASEVWDQAVKSSGNKQIQNYSIKNKFSVGDILEHSSFGKGVVQELLSNGRIAVIFHDDVRTLVHCK